MADIYPPELKNNLERLMSEQRLSQKDLAAIIGVSKTTIWRYINREKFPRPVHIVSLCRALKCELGDLFYVTPPEK